MFRELNRNKDNPRIFNCLDRRRLIPDCPAKSPKIPKNRELFPVIQRDGTFSVVPRIYGGVTSAAELRRIADVAVKYDVPMVKITGGQRIDLLGVKKEQLPAMWKDLGMPSGHAYTKSFRTCKSCVGIAHLRDVLVDDSQGVCARLDSEIAAAVAAYKDPWATDAAAPAYPAAAG